MNSGIESLSAARRTRLHRISAAQFLASLESSCSVDELAQIDWNALEAVPHWCLAERATTNRLQLVSGAVLLAPFIVQWLDGKRIKQARTLVGDHYFDAAMRVGASRVSTESYQSSEPVPELLASAGAAVIVGAVEHPAIQKILSKQFPMDVKQLDENVATSVYRLALEIIDQLQVSTAPIENRASRTEAGTCVPITDEAVS